MNHLRIPLTYLSISPDPLLCCWLVRHNDVIIFDIILLYCFYPFLLSTTVHITSFLGCWSEVLLWLY